MTESLAECTENVNSGISAFDQKVMQKLEENKMSKSNLHSIWCSQSPPK